MVIVLLIVFVICWTPLQVILLLQAFGIDFEEANHVSNAKFSCCLIIPTNHIIEFLKIPYIVYKYL